MDDKPTRHIRKANSIQPSLSYGRGGPHPSSLRLNGHNPLEGVQASAAGHNKHSINTDKTASRDDVALPLRIDYSAFGGRS